jgi:hypothetical protein
MGACANPSRSLLRTITPQAGPNRRFTRPHLILIIRETFLNCEKLANGGHGCQEARTRLGRLRKPCGRDAATRVVGSVNTPRRPDALVATEWLSPASDRRDSALYAPTQEGRRAVVTVSRRRARSGHGSCAPRMCSYEGCAINACRRRACPRCRESGPRCARECPGGHPAKANRMTGSSWLPRPGCRRRQANQSRRKVGSTRPA